jgi:3,4-dihydroxy 2-butanone 4-phosphate synthase/GTP cyclohydrolase II
VAEKVVSLAQTVAGVKAKSEDLHQFLSPIEEIVEDMRAGKMVILVDDENRENEGDLIVAAEKATPEVINFMARFGRGLVCLSMTRSRVETLGLPMMTRENRSGHGTAFTISIEAREGVTTGISAYDRAHTVRTAVRPDAQPEDLRQPGHVFPLMAQPGGVLTRAGHTEAGCDLTRLAGLEPAAVIVEIMSEDGTMARRPELEEFAQRHGLRIGTIADLIRYRLRTERSVERLAERDVDTEHGRFHLVCYEDHVGRDVHLALVRGRLDSLEPPLVRVHLIDTLRDVLGVRDESRAWTLPAAMERVAREDAGVIVILRQAEAPRELADAVGSQRRTHEHAGETRGVLRTFGVGAQILQDLGVQRMRVLSAPKQLHGLSAFGLEIVEYIGDQG